MKIECNKEFLTLFFLYRYYLECKEIDDDDPLTIGLKDYLLYHGFSVGKYEIRKDSKGNEFNVLVDTQIINRLDELLVHYYKYHDL